MSVTVGASPVTPGALIARALRIIGVGAIGQTLQQQDQADGLATLNEMLAQWQRLRWLVWALRDVACVSTGMTTYQVGQGAQIDTGYRVDRIEGAYARLLTSGATGTIGGEFSSEFSNEFASADTPATGAPVAPDFAQPGFGSDFQTTPSTAYATRPQLAIDYPLEIIESREDWSAIGLKGLSTFPTACFLDSGYPYGTLFVWPVPPAQRFEIHVLVKQAISQVADPTVAFAMPAEYAGAIVWNLVLRLAPSYGMPIPDGAAMHAAAGLDAIRTANLQISELGMPSAVLPRRGRGSSPFWGGFPLI